MQNQQFLFIILIGIFSIGTIYCPQKAMMQMDQKINSNQSGSGKIRNEFVDQFYQYNGQNPHGTDQAWQNVNNTDQIWKNVNSTDQTWQNVNNTDQTGQQANNPDHIWQNANNTYLTWQQAEQFCGDISSPPDHDDGLKRIHSVEKNTPRKKASSIYTTNTDQLEQILPDQKAQGASSSHNTNNKTDLKFWDKIIMEDGQSSFPQTNSDEQWQIGELLPNPFAAAVQEHDISSNLLLTKEPLNRHQVKIADQFQDLSPPDQLQDQFIDLSPPDQLQAWSPPDQRQSKSSLNHTQSKQLNHSLLSDQPVHTNNHQKATISSSVHGAKMPHVTSSPKRSARTNIIKAASMADLVQPKKLPSLKTKRLDDLLTPNHTLSPTTVLSPGTSPISPMLQQHRTAMANSPLHTKHHTMISMPSSPPAVLNSSMLHPQPSTTVTHHSTIGTETNSPRRTPTQNTVPATMTQRHTVPMNSTLNQQITMPLPYQQSLYAVSGHVSAMPRPSTSFSPLKMKSPMQMPQRAVPAQRRLAFAMNPPFSTVSNPMNPLHVGTLSVTNAPNVVTTPPLAQNMLQNANIATANATVSAAPLITVPTGPLPTMNNGQQQGSSRSAILGRQLGLDPIKVATDLAQLAIETTISALSVSIKAPMNNDDLKKILKRNVACLIIDNPELNLKQILDNASANSMFGRPTAESFSRIVASTIKQHTDNKPSSSSSRHYYGDKVLTNANIYLQIYTQINRILNIAANDGVSAVNKPVNKRAIKMQNFMTRGGTQLKQLLDAWHARTLVPALFQDDQTTAAQNFRMEYFMKHCIHLIKKC